MALIEDEDGTWEDDGKTRNLIRPSAAYLERLNSEKSKPTQLELMRQEMPPLEIQLDAIWIGGETMEAMRANILDIRQRHGITNLQSAKIKDIGDGK